MGVFDDIAEVFAVYEAEIQFREKLMGGIPGDPKTIKNWYKAKAGITDEVELNRVVMRTLAENGSDTVGLSEVNTAEMDADELYDLYDQVSGDMTATKQTNVFKRDEQGLYIEDRQIKAMIKEGTNILFASEKWGKTRKGPKNFLSERVFVNPARIHLGREEADGVELVVGHVADKQGKRSTLTHYEYVERATINFSVKVVKDEITHEQWVALWQHAQENGLGALRSQSHGRFELEAWNKVN